MLYYETVSDGTLGLLNAVQSNSFFKGLRLVGRTSLALQYGHRTSIDLDFFGDIDSSHEMIMNELSTIGEVNSMKNSKNIHIFSVNGVKMDFVNYPFPWLDDALFENNLVLAKEKDIAAMKISAITGRGTRKDFVDLFFLLKRFTLKEILDLFISKYKDASPYLAIKSLLYFDDAEMQDMPEMFSDVSWAQIKKEIQEAHVAYMNTL